ncbi:1848_t:CDS:1, partial [Acaulospora colombiana]
WWDNNGGKNYKVVFKKASTTSSTPSAAKVSSPLRFSDGPKKMYPGLDLRQTTLLTSSDPSIPPLKLKKPAFSASGTSTPPKAAPSAPAATTVNAVVAPPPPFATSSSNATSAHQRIPSNTSLVSSSSSGSLRLSNYASPTSPVASGRNHSRGSSMMWQDGELGPIVGGQPITSPPTPPALQVPDQDNGPTPKKRSPTNSIASTVSPASTGIPITPASPDSNDRTPPANGFPNGKNTSYPFTSNDSRYAALVEQWCFHQSPPPGMGNGAPSEMATPALGPAAGTSPNISSGYGSGYGYGHQYSIGKPLTLKP